MSNYQDINCCNGCRDIDHMINLYHEEKRKIMDHLTSLDENKEIWGNILSYDPHCLSHGGKHNRYTNYTCAPCNNLSRIVDLDNDIDGKPFLLECGKNVGENLILISLPVGKVISKISRNSKERALSFLERNKIMLECGTSDIRDMTFLSLDTFTNNIVVWWIVNDLLDDLPYKLNLYTSYICRDKGFILSSSPTIGNYYQFKAKAKKEGWDLSCISLQLAVILDRLSGSYFTHGNASVDTLLFSEEDIEHDYKGNSVKCHFITHIIDYTHSSINLDKTRIYPTSTRSSLLLNYANLNIDIKDGKYKLVGRTDVVFDYIRHSGLPLYTSSFDFYCYIVSLMLDTDFYESMMKNDRAWKSIWSEDEIDVIEKRIASSRDKDADVVRLLGGLWLHCNVIDVWLSGSR